MSQLLKPLRIPRIPNFSSGPCAKRPGWNLNVLNKMSYNSHVTIIFIAAVFTFKHTYVNTCVNW